MKTIYNHKPNSNTQTFSVENCKHFNTPCLHNFGALELSAYGKFISWVHNTRSLQLYAYGKCLSEYTIITIHDYAKTFVV